MKSQKNPSTASDTDIVARDFRTRSKMSPSVSQPTKATTCSPCRSSRRRAEESLDDQGNHLAVRASHPLEDMWTLIVAHAGESWSIRSTLPIQATDGRTASGH